MKSKNIKTHKSHQIMMFLILTLLTISLVSCQAPESSVQAKTITYNIKFNGNGSNSGSMKTMSGLQSGKTYTLPKNTFKKTSYYFKRWNTKADGSGTNYPDQKLVKNVTATDKKTVTLYAQWGRKKYTIIFDGNGSTSGSMENMSCLCGKNYTLTANTFKKGRYTFKGWNTKKDGSGTTYKNKAEVRNLCTSNGATVTLYAQWKQKTYDPADQTSVSIPSPLTMKLNSYYNGDKITYSCKYSDKLFTKASDSMDLDIAKCSALLEVACSNEDQVNQFLYNAGFTCIKNYNYDILRESRDQNLDLVSFTVGKKTVKINGENYNLIACGVMGTHAFSEWFSNLKIGTTGVHEGFQNSAISVCEILERDYLVEDGSKNILWITGGSRGAAVANFVGGIYSIDPERKDKIENAHIFAYTFGAPAVSNKADTRLKNSYNFVNEGDTMIQFTLKKWNFTRYGETVIVSKDSETVQKFKKKFKEFTGYEYNGYTKNPSMNNALEEWAPTLEEFYKEYEFKTNNGTWTLRKKDFFDMVVFLTSFSEFFSEEEYKEVANIFIESLKASAKGDGFDIPVEFFQSCMPDEKVSTLAEAVKLLNTVEKVKKRIHVDYKAGISHSMEAYYSWLYAL